MVDIELLKELKRIMDLGPEGADPTYTLKAFEFFSQLAKENEEIIDMLKEINIKVQVIIFDTDYKYWLTASEGSINYGEGEIADASLTMSTSMEIAVGMLYGDFDPVSAYMSGEIIMEGNLADAMEFQDILDVAMEDFEELTKNL